MTRRTAAIALGANLGDRERSLTAALRDLERTPGVIVLRRSHWIETAPVGGPLDQPTFLNGAALIETTLESNDLLSELQRIEHKYGRERDVPNGPRTLDLDLLYIGDEVRETEALQLPHPRMEERLFVLEPLSEIDPGHRLVRCGKSVEERVAELREVACKQG